MLEFVENPINRLKENLKSIIFTKESKFNFYDLNDTQKET